MKTAVIIKQIYFVKNAFHQKAIYLDTKMLFRQYRFPVIKVENLMFGYLFVFSIAWMDTL